MGKHTKPRQPTIRKAIGVRPYNPQGKSNLGFAQGKTGVYIIREKQPGKRYKTVYVGKSIQHLYKTITRHFQVWNDKDQPNRTTYHDKLKSRKYIIQVIFCHHKQVVPFEAGLIEKYNPRDNTNAELPSNPTHSTNLVEGLDDIDYTDDLDIDF